MKLRTTLLPLLPALAAKATAATSSAAAASGGGFSHDQIYIIALGAILIVGAWLGRCTSRRS